MKKEAEQIFEEFFDSDEETRGRDGIYSSHYFGPEERRVQVILLDTRYFRSPLKRGKVDGRQGYVPVSGEGVTMLGEAQWEWLEKELAKPARVRIIGSSIQVVPAEHRFEKWANMPDERQRLFDLIKSTDADGCVIISGDRHLAEISKLEATHYPIYEVTSSSLNRSGGGSDDEPNRHRIAGGNYRANNFGLITIDWEKADPILSLQIHGENGDSVRGVQVPLSELQ